MTPAFDRLILASASPRRSELLRQIGVSFEVAAQDIDETPREGEFPEDYVCRLALEKSLAVGEKAAEPPAFPVLGADTVVVCQGRLLGKPADREHALEMLRSLSGSTHEVLSAVAITYRNRKALRLSRTAVSFRPLDEEECLRYWLSGEPRGKAGAYAIQGLAAMFVTAIKGSYSGVVGLPLYETCELLEEFDVSTGLSV